MPPNTQEGLGEVEGSGMVIVSNFKVMKCGLFMWRTHPEAFDLMEGLRASQRQCRCEEDVGASKRRPNFWSAISLKTPLCGLQTS